ncbi:MAG: agmatine deiminase family protein [Polyangiaceae bacterium]|jgi:agmatine deiminase
MFTPREAGFRMPAEWASHSSTWLAWPSRTDLWEGHLEPARAAFVEIVSAIVEGEIANVLVPDEENAKRARAALPAHGVRFHMLPFGDIWLRDTAPLFLLGPHMELATVRFGFNGWGGKYVLAHDDCVAERIGSTLAGVRGFTMPWVLEGGAVEVDGDGTVLTTRQCLLNPNRNPSMGEAQIADGLLQGLGCERVLWLNEGLKNDHTDGHVDTLARFVRPGVVVAMEPRSGDDPNREVLHAILRQLATEFDARGRRLEVARIPSPGRIADDEGRVMPASYVNFYVSNATVVVPTYGSPFDDEVVERIGALFPDRRAVGVDARAVLTGGGAFHCITQQEPRGRAR